MLADAVESARRVLVEPTPSRIESLVEEIAMKRLLDGQLDECGRGRTATEALEPQRTGTGKQFQHPRTLSKTGQAIEDGQSHFVRCGTYT